MGRLAGAVPSSLTRRIPYDLRVELRDALGAPEPGDLTFAVPPPPCPAGHHVGPPDIVVVGSEASGGRRWFDALAAQSGVATVSHPDQAAHLLARFATEGFGSDAAEAFLAWFPRLPGQVVVYWCPDGLVYPWMTAVLAEVAPEARWVVPVRDPLDQLSDELANTAERRPWHPGSYFADALDRCLVASHLQRLMNAVGAKRIEVVQVERFGEDGLAQWSDVCSTIGLTGGLTGPGPGPGEVRSSPGVPRRVSEDAAIRLSALIAADAEHLERLVPRFDSKWWPSLQHLL